jgi:hypothetical protein
MAQETVVEGMGHGGRVRDLFCKHHRAADALCGAEEPLVQAAECPGADARIVPSVGEGVHRVFPDQ